MGKNQSRWVVQVMDSADMVAIFVADCWAEAHEICREADLAGLYSEAYPVSECGRFARWIPCPIPAVVLR